MCRLLAITVPEIHQDSITDIMIPSLDALASTALRLLADDGAKGNKDGTGVSQLRDTIRYGYKSSYEANIMTVDEEYRKFMRNVDWTRPLLGHVRLASVGKDVRNANKLLPGRHAQPFTGDKCVLMHNGTIKNWRWIAQDNKIEDYKDWTDSWLITRLLDKDNWTYELWKQVVEQLEGSYALIGAHKQNDKELWIVRHKRPLYLYEIDDGKLNIICTSKLLDVALMEVGETVYKLTGQDAWRKWDSIKLDEEELFKLSTEGEGSLKSLGKIEVFVPVQQSYSRYATGTFAGFEIADIFYDLLQEYPFSSSELRDIWEAREDASDIRAWSPEAARMVVRFIRWCLTKDERLDVLASELKRPIYKETA